MKEHRVLIVETLATTVPVWAETAEQAEDLVRSMYRNCKIVLTASDYVYTEFEVIPNHMGESVPPKLVPA